MQQPVLRPPEQVAQGMEGRPEEQWSMGGLPRSKALHCWMLGASSQTMQGDASEGCSIRGSSALSGHSSGEAVPEQTNRAVVTGVSARLPGDQTPLPRQPVPSMPPVLAASLHGSAARVEAWPVGYAEVSRYQQLSPSAQQHALLRDQPHGQAPGETIWPVAVGAAAHSGSAHSEALLLSHSP